MGEEEGLYNEHINLKKKNKEKEIEEERRQKDTPMLMYQKNLLKWPFYAAPVKIQMVAIIYLVGTVSNYMWKCKLLWSAKTTLNKKAAMPEVAQRPILDFTA